MIARLALVLALACLFAACGAAKPTATAPPAQVVTAVAAVPGSLSTPLRLSGSLIARDEAVVAAEGGSARIVQMAVDVGDRVSLGQELIRLDDADALAQQTTNAAERRRATAVIAQAEAQLAEAKAGAEEARQALVRARQAADSGAITPDILDARVAADASAQARIAAAMATIGVARADAERLDAIGNELALALRRTRIVSPASGLVLSRPARLGARAEPGIALLTLAVDGIIEFSAEAPEHQLAGLAVGQAATVAVGDRRIAGTVRRIDPEVQTMTRLGSLRITFATGEGLLPGMSATAVLTPPPVEGVLVPLTALQRRDGRAGVLVATPDGPPDAAQRVAGTVKRVEVTVGAEDATSAVITSGLAAGALVIAKAPDFVADGARCILLVAGK